MCTLLDVHLVGCAPCWMCRFRGSLGSCGLCPRTHLHFGSRPWVQMHLSAGMEGSDGDPRPTKRTFNTTGQTCALSGQRLKQKHSKFQLVCLFFCCLSLIRTKKKLDQFAWVDLHDVQHCFITLFYCCFFCWFLRKYRVVKKMMIEMN